MRVPRPNRDARPAEPPASGVTGAVDGVGVDSFMIPHTAMHDMWRNFSRWPPPPRGTRSSSAMVTVRWWCHLRTPQDPATAKLEERNRGGGGTCAGAPPEATANLE